MLVAEPLCVRPRQAVKSVAKKVDKEAKKSGFSLPNPFAK